MNIIQKNPIEHNQSHQQTIRPSIRSQSEEKKENDIQMSKRSIRIQKKQQFRIVNKKSAKILIKLFQQDLKETTKTILGEQHSSEGDILRLQFLINHKEISLSCLINLLRNPLINQLAEYFFGNLKWIRLSLSQNFQSTVNTKNLLTTSEFILEQVIERKNELLIDV